MTDESNSDQLADDQGPVPNQDSGDVRVELDPDGEDAFSYSHSANFPELLTQLQATLVVSTYQAGKLVLFRAVDDRLSMLPRTFDKAMGLAVSRKSISIGTRFQLWNLPNEPILAPRIKPEGTHDACFVPRDCHVTANIDIHEIAEAGGRMWMVNTLFSCLCTIDPDFSFVPRWQPPFVSRLIREDRCHLNGMAIADDKPAYVTAFAETDTKEGWRDHKIDGGCVIDVGQDEVIVRGLSMPHSPRVYQNKLWVLDSGTGRLITVDRSSGEVTSVAELPGYTRGLAFAGRFAFVGLSQIRETAIFGGVPIAENLDQRKCGIWVVDIVSGESIAFIEFQGAVQEIFDVQLLHGIRFPALIGLEKKTVQRACVIGPLTPIDR